MEKIDFIIPCHKKDFDTLELVISGIKNHTNCRNLYIISREEISNKNVIPIHENKYKEFADLNRIKVRWNSEFAPLAKRSGWLYQQLLKLNSYRVIPNLTTSHVIVDADTIFLRDIEFNPNKFQFLKASEYHIPYLKTYEKLMKEPTSTGFSFICHHMIFNSNILQELINKIENIHQKSFQDSILDSIDYKENSTFSEWDLYGNFVFNNHKDIMECRQLNWTNIRKIPNESELKYLSERFHYVSPQAWMRGIE